MKKLIEKYGTMTYDELDFYQKTLQLTRANRCLIDENSFESEIGYRLFVDETELTKVINRHGGYFNNSFEQLRKFEEIIKAKQ